MRRAFQWDLARQVEALDVLLDVLPRYASWGYQELYLHLEDSVVYPSLPEVARGDAYSHELLLELAAAAKRAGIDVVPIVNLLGHTQYLIKTPEWRDLNELRDAADNPLATGQICPLHPRVPELVERLLDDTVPFCTAGRIHVGLDESFHLGKCPRCRKEVERIGLAAHFANHARRLNDAVRRRGLRMCLWGDMAALLPELMPLLPSDVIVFDWYYYPFDRNPRAELLGFTDYDLAPALRENGLAWWGCPMSGAFRWEPLPIFSDRLENARSWWKRCELQGAEGFLVTSWEAYRLALPVTAAVDAAIASLWLDGPELAAEEMLARGFARLAGLRPTRAHHAAARLALKADAYPFSGYYEWEASQRWDGGVSVAEPHTLDEVADSIIDLEREGKRLVRICAIQDAAVIALGSSLRLRAVLAERARFIRRAADVVERLRRANRGTFSELVQARIIANAVESARAFADQLEKGLGAAREMWAFSRNPAETGQNHAVLAADARRLGEWLDWLSDVLAGRIDAASACPVFGERRLRFAVRVDHPAVQRVSVELLHEGRELKEIAARHTIEFQSFAALPRAKIVRPFSVALPGDAASVAIVVRGTGEVCIEGVRVEDGVTSRPIRPSRKRLGMPPPTSGLPDLTKVNGEWVIELAPKKAPPAKAGLEE